MCYMNVDSELGTKLDLVQSTYYKFKTNEMENALLTF